MNAWKNFRLRNKRVWRVDVVVLVAVPGSEIRTTENQTAIDGLTREEARSFSRDIFYLANNVIHAFVRRD